MDRYEDFGDGMEKWDDGYWVKFEDVEQLMEDARICAEIINEHMPCSCDSCRSMFPYLSAVNRILEATKDVEL